MSRTYFILILSISQWSAAQWVGQWNNLILQTKVSIQIGAPFSFIGLNSHIRYAQPHFELGVGFQSKFYYSGLGPKGSYFENRTQLDAKILWGKTTERNPLFLSSFFNQSNKDFSLSYAYFLYWDTRNTSQNSGAWSTELGKMFIYFENDLFAGQGRDRFRTGTLQFIYRDSMNLFSLNTRIWTGETRGAKAMSGDSYFANQGYKDLRDMLFGKFSNGIVSVSFFRALELTPIGIEIGIDNEKVRNIFQNKLAHDLPRSVNKNKLKNLHLPMLDQDGNPYTRKDAQMLRKPRLVAHGIIGFMEN